ncbi:archaeal DNA polymerase II, large subunit [Cenarchaeum symbiosum A]|uniref:DNA polymerase II large subunit n=1 Tax=Cenarchaeum symbiosum (strain A) TaxID=414004 RepID=DP2L_CENSY|nr:RecName: Full=DNA polymerase II large subunit; Short=Pol II; AltName: Full=Exodeoxyribonuclease large subunit [Cenarchaeum symbiosum A]ABK78437.1 archaeal DNA polymerase II, large subunit [Cenarchaeum symbiosum A]
MSGGDVEEYLRGADMPEEYRRYYSSLSGGTYDIFEKAASAKSNLADSSGMVEPKIAVDLSDRVAKMHDLDIAGPLRELLATKGKELAALMLAKEIMDGKYLPEADIEKRIDSAVRVGLAVVTEGVTIAPLQGIADVITKKNKDGSEYLSVSIAGPMRSAGGTESAVTMLIADYVRRQAGLAEYQADSLDDETGRFIEELRIYEREVGSFQFHVLDEDIRAVISHLPVELDGVDTDPYEVVNHKGMSRIQTDRVRGGALRVLNDGLIGRSKKLLKRIELYGLDGWEWLAELKGAVQTGENKEDAAAKRMREVITGRSVLSMPNRLGGFRLRYGRACNTGYTSVGFHPAVAEILDHTIAVGTQVKIDIPGKGATVAFVDTIEAPTVRLAGGDVVKIRDVAHGIELKGSIERILHLGDMLISFGDFLENNAQLVPSGYVEEIWKMDMEAAGAAQGSPSSADEAVRISRELGVPLHPRYLYYWDQISHEELAMLLSPLDKGDAISYPAACKPVLEKLGVPHKAGPEGPVLEGDEARIFRELILDNPPGPDASAPVPELISRSSGITIRDKFSTSIGVRIGRPEKAAPRQMRPPTHCLFPVGGTGGPTNNLLKSAARPGFSADILSRRCPGCGEPSISIRCWACGERTAVERTCMQCGTDVDGEECERCGRPGLAHSRVEFPLKKMLVSAQEKTGVRAHDPLKGVKELAHQDRIAEPLEKGLIRQSRSLTVFKDGTVRFDATNSPMTHFKPSWIGTSAEKLRELGYETDVDGKKLEGPDQLVELRMQDIVIPLEGAKYLVSACGYIDAELDKLYGAPPFYKVPDLGGLIGHLVVGLAPHTSVGVAARIIGYTETHVCFGTPNWHSAKRRDADGDADSIILLMDALLNFSRHYLSDRIGGLMDAPLLIQPLVLPHESQSQAHNIEVVKRLPPGFYEAAAARKKASEVGCVEIVKSRLETAGQFGGYHFTHGTSSLTTSRPRSAYSTLGSMLDKLDLQIRNANLIAAVDAAEIISNVISTHLVPDIMGNLRAYARQNFRCTACGKSYRRIPLAQRCSCGNGLIQTITRASVEKYLKLAKRLVNEYDVGAYQRGRIHALSDEIELVFGKGGGDQALLTDF